MKIKKAKREAKAVRRQLKANESFPEGRLSVENLNPNGQVVKSMEMTIRRSRALGTLCRQHLDLCGGDTHEAKRVSPAGWGSLDVKRMKKVGDHAPVNPRKALRDALGDAWWNHPEYRVWSDTFDRWWSGSLERAEKALLLNLPESVRSKYE